VATRIGAVRLQVADLARSIVFYTSVLGFTVLHQAGGSAGLGIAGATAPLLWLEELPGALPVPQRGRLGLYHFAILLPDRAALGRLVRHLGRVHVRVGSADHLVSEALYLSDPDGLGIEVYADRPRASWPRGNHQLQMATDPLDLDSLLAAAGDQPWSGLPTGTTVGHIHLHVGDLERAAAFYHVALGLDAMVWGYPGALFLAAGGYHHHLGLNTWAGPQAKPAQERDARLLEWELLLPDAAAVDEAARSLMGAGHVATPMEGGWSSQDPWGTRLLLGVMPMATTGR
jgi:catechol 2,3-dioxygenase